VGFLAWLLREWHQIRFMIQIYSEEFSAMPDLMKLASNVHIGTTSVRRAVNKIVGTRFSKSIFETIVGLGFAPNLP